jgi:RNA polymerase primary sigma factor
MAAAMLTRRPRTLSSFDSYLSEIDQTELLTSSEEKDLAVRIQEGDSVARDHLVRANLRLVVNIARKYMGKGLTVEDLVGEGNMGLLRAAEGYDPNMGTRFATYATYWIRQSIRRALSRDGNTLRLPSYMLTLLAKWHRAAGGFAREWGRPGTEDEIAERMKLSKRQRRAVQKALLVLASGHSSGSPEGQSTIDQIASNRCGCPSEELHGFEQLRDALNGLTNLDDREATILKMRFGLEGEKPVTLKEVGERLGFTKERIRQIERVALAKLRQHVAA